MTAWISSSDLSDMPSHIIGLIKQKTIYEIARFRRIENVQNDEPDQVVWKDMYIDAEVSAVINIFSSTGYRVKDCCVSTIPGSGLITYTWVMQTSQGQGGPLTASGFKDTEYIPGQLTSSSSLLSTSSFVLNRGSYRRKNEIPVKPSSTIFTKKSSEIKETEVVPSPTTCMPGTSKSFDGKISSSSSSFPNRCNATTDLKTCQDPTESTKYSDVSLSEIPKSALFESSPTAYDNTKSKASDFKRSSQPTTISSPSKTSDLSTQYSTLPCKHNDSELLAKKFDSISRISSSDGCSITKWEATPTLSTRASSSGVTKLSEQLAFTEISSKASTSTPTHLINSRSGSLDSKILTLSEPSTISREFSKSYTSSENRTTKPRSRSLSPQSDTTETCESSHVSKSSSIANNKRSITTRSRLLETDTGTIQLVNFGKQSVSPRDDTTSASYRTSTSKVSTPYNQDSHQISQPPIKPDQSSSDKNLFKSSAPRPPSTPYPGRSKLAKFKSLPSNYSSLSVSADTCSDKSTSSGPSTAPASNTKH